MTYTKRDQCFYRSTFVIALAGSTHKTNDGDELEKSYQRTQETSVYCHGSRSEQNDLLE